MSIDAPRDGGMSEAWAVRVRGHLLSETGLAQEIVTVAPGSVLAMATMGLPTPEVAARHPNVRGAAACGFTLLVDTLGLPQRFEFRLRAALSDGSRVKVAAIAGERRELTTAYAPRLQPLLVTSLGRMGTTLLMRMLSAHPGVVVYARPPYEARGGKYWVHVLKTLAAFCQRSIDGWYLATAAAQSEADAALVYFAEKHFPDAYPRLLRELYPAARE